MIGDASAAERLRLRGVRVLVVEDDTDLRESTVACLDMEGADVFCAATGNSGFERFVEVRPQVIVSDLWMPNGTGYDLIGRVRALPSEAGGLTPAVAVSAAGKMHEAIAAGFQMFLAKPFDLFRLVEIIAQLASADRGRAAP
jgi:CheY-like chemotaxis protein